MDAQMKAFNPEPGKAEFLEASVQRVLAPNPSPMTFRGTNTYLVGTKDIAVIDPGPTSEPHLEAIMRALSPEQSISHIVVTHAHLDHSPLAARLAQETDAKIYGFGGPKAGRSTVMQSLADAGLAGGGEGVDEAFSPDVTVADGDVIAGTDWRLEVLHTPGHFGNHISLALDDICFCGDHVMGWASSLVSPPDGDLTDFMMSCEKLRARPWRVFHPGHGAPVEDPKARLSWLIEHRKGREREIVHALQAAPATTKALAAQIYTDTPQALFPAAERNVFAHLIDLVGKNVATSKGPLCEGAMFELL
ncbi:MBL fold metallo-hydrolase [Shimia sp. NS0008-38b]